MDKDFTEREFSEFSGFGELPDDLRGMGENSTPCHTTPGNERDIYTTNGGASRDTLAPTANPVPDNCCPSIAINYLPRFNFESFRSQRFYAGGTALLPPDNTFYDFLVNPATLLPSSPVKFTMGILAVPVGYAAVITQVGQWIGDPTAFQKLNGQPDDIVWRVQTGGTSVFNWGAFNFVISAMDNEAKFYTIVNEATTIQISVKNTLTPSSPLARSIPVQFIIKGYWFPMDELNDIFRNK